MTSHNYKWWVTNNPILGQNQIGWVADLNLYKIGDGVSNFSNLPYQNQSPILSWFSIPYKVHSKGALMTSLAQIPLLVGMFTQQGNWGDFRFVINTGNNIDEKTIQLLFGGTQIYTLTGSLQNITIWLEGKITCIDYNNGKIGCEIEYSDSIGGKSKTYSVVTGFNFQTTLDLICQAQGVENYDIELQLGRGIYSSIAIPNPLL